MKETMYTGHVYCHKCGQMHWMYALCKPITPIPAPDLSQVPIINWEEFLSDVQKSTGQDLGGGTANF